MKKSAILIGDHSIAQWSLGQFLGGLPDFEVIGKVGGGDEAIKMAAELKPDVIIVYIDPTVSKHQEMVETMQQIKSNSPSTPIFILSDHDDEELALRFFEVGCTGYLFKPADPIDISQAIRTTASGDWVMDSHTGSKLVTLFANRLLTSSTLEMDAKLSPREVTVLKLVAKGLSNKEIAKELGLTVYTVKTYLAEVFSKMMVDSRMEAVILALRTGLLSSRDLE